MSDTETESTLTPTIHPESQAGHGRYRLSWWEPNVLAGIEIWPDSPGNEGDDEFPQSYFVARVKRPSKGYAVNGGARHGFRRRCGWCCVVLRGWQLNLCRTCNAAAGSIPLPGQGLGSSPFVHGSRYDDAPDKMRFPWKTK